MDTAWIQARIDATKAEIEAYETAVSSLLSGSKSWMLDTGQTRQSVTKEDLSSIRLARDNAYANLQVLWGQLYGSGGQARPAW